jgi:hypothetical protein
MFWIATVVFFVLAIGSWLINKRQVTKSKRISAWNILFVSLGIACFLAAVSLLPPDARCIPIAVFVCVFFFYLAAEVIFFRFFRDPTTRRAECWKNFHKNRKTNPLKGWGGATVAEFSTGIGLLVTIGIYRLYAPSSGVFWWAAQISALVSVMSSAAWVQRFVLEGPEKQPTPEDEEKTAETEAEEDAKQHTPWSEQPRTVKDYVAKTVASTLNSLCAMLTALAVCVPIEDNMAAKTLGAGDYWPVIYAVWTLVFLIWAVIAFYPTRRSVDRWPIWTTGGSIWKNRENLEPAFLYPTTFFAFISFIFMAFCFVWIAVANTSFWDKQVGGWLGIIPAGLYVASFFLKWLTCDEAELFLFKDVILCLCGIGIFFVQAISTFGNDSQVSEVNSGGWAILYIVVLAVMAFVSVSNLYNAAYNWCDKPPYETTTFISGVPTDVEMTPMVHARMKTI